MAALILLLGVILIVAGVRNTQGTLFGALGQDVPAFLVWGAAIVAIGVIGFVPGLKTPSRWLLALVLMVIVLHNYQQILAGFSSVAKPSASTSSGATSVISALLSGSSTAPTSASAATAPESAVDSAFATSEVA